MSRGCVCCLGCRSVWSADTQILLSRDGRSVVVEPYAPNIVRITLISTKTAALAAAGYGIVGTPSKSGWTQELDAEGYDVIRSGRMVIRVAPQNLPPPHAMPLDDLNDSLRDRYFGGGSHKNIHYDDAISIADASGKPLLTMRNWSMIPNQPGTASGNAASGQKADPGYRVSVAVFDFYLPVSTTTGWASISRVISTSVTSVLSAGTTTTQLAERLSASPSWCRAATTA